MVSKVKNENFAFIKLKLERNRNAYNTQYVEKCALVF